MDTSNATQITDLISALSDPDTDQVATWAEIAQHARAGLSEAMAADVTAGASMRQVARSAGVSVTTVGSYLGQAPSMARYASDGRVGSNGIGAARMQFTARKDTADD